MSTSEIITEIPPASRDMREFQLIVEQNFAKLKTLLVTGEGITDTFTTVDGKTVTVVDGIITDIV